MGSAVLQAIMEQIQMLSERFGINLNVRGIANSKKMLLGVNLIEELKTKMVDHSVTSNSSRQPVGGLRRAHSNDFLQNITSAFNQDGPGKTAVDMDLFLNHVQSGICIFYDVLFILLSFLAFF